MVTRPTSDASADSPSGESPTESEPVEGRRAGMGPDAARARGPCRHGHMVHRTNEILIIIHVMKVIVRGARTNTGPADDRDPRIPRGLQTTPPAPRKPFRQGISWRNQALVGLDESIDRETPSHAQHPSLESGGSGRLRPDPSCRSSLTTHVMDVTTGHVYIIIDAVKIRGIPETTSSGCGTARQRAPAGDGPRGRAGHRSSSAPLAGAGEEPRDLSPHSGPCGSGASGSGASGLSRASRRRSGGPGVHGARLRRRARRRPRGGPAPPRGPRRRRRRGRSRPARRT